MTKAPAPPSDPASARLVSLDAFRGATIAAMILVNNPGSWAHVYPPLLHAPWHGWTPTDLIFPFFLFIMGVALPYSFARRRELGDSHGRLTLHILRRSLVIVGLGIFMAAFPEFDDWHELRIPGVLQRIGVVYLVAGLLFLRLSARSRLVVGAALLLTYWAAMMLVPVPGFGPGQLSPEGNLGAWLDREILGQAHLWRNDPWDPEGILSTIPAVVTSLLGVAFGQALRAGGAQLTNLLRLAGWSAAGVAAGLLWGLWFPINKNLWTSSYVLFSGGAAGVLLTLSLWAIDRRGLKRWSMPFVVYGRNPIAVFVGSGLLTKMLLRWRLPADDGTISAYSWIYRNIFASWAGPLNGSLLFALAHVAFWLTVAWVLYRNRIIIKI